MPARAVSVRHLTLDDFAKRAVLAIASGNRDVAEASEWLRSHIREPG